VFVNSHLLLEVEQVCDHIAIMHQGRVLQQGTLQEVRGAVREEHALLNVRFATGQVSTEAREAVAAIGGVGDAEGGLLVGLKNEDEITRVIDVLREHSVKIFAIEPNRVNLEEAFINLIDQQGDQSVGAQREE
jgi:ABC-2 type transport system ATP-binding protein